MAILNKKSNNILVVLLALTLIFISAKVVANTTSKMNDATSSKTTAKATINASTTQVTANTAEQYIEQARIKARQEDLETAAILYQKAIKLEDDNLIARKELANVLMEAQLNDNSVDQSEAELAALNELKPGTAYAPSHFSLGYLANVALGPQDKSLNFETLLVLTQLQNGEHESVIKTANLLQKKSPDHPIPQNLLGLAWAAKGETNKARDHYLKALSLKQDFHAARINLAELEIRSGDYKKAKVDLNQVLKIDKNNRRACLLMAKLSELEGNTAEAKRWYQQTTQNY